MAFTAFPIPTTTLFDQNNTWTGTQVITPPSGLNKALSIVQTAAGTPSQDTIGGVAGVGWNFNQIGVTDNGIDVSGFPAGSNNTNGLTVQYLANGSYGNPQAIYGVIGVTADVPVANTFPNFAAGNFIGYCYVNVGGTNTGAGAKGAIFGSGAYANAVTNATNLLHVCGISIGTGINAGCSAKIHSCIAVGPTSGHAVHGALYDAIMLIGSETAVGMNNGILFSQFAGHHPIHSGGTLIATQDATTVTSGIDFSSYTFTGDFIKSATAQITGDGSLVLAKDCVIGANNTYFFNGLAGFQGTSNGVIRLIDNTGTSFNRLQFGGTTSSFPSLKRSSAAIVVRLADDSANADLVTRTTQTDTTTVGALPAAASGNKGTRYMVSDANATMTAGIGAVVAAGGANIVPVYSDGTNWRIG